MMEAAETAAAARVCADDRGECRRVPSHGRPPLFHLAPNDRGHLKLLTRVYVADTAPGLSANRAFWKNHGRCAAPLV